MEREKVTNTGKGSQNH